MYDFFHNCNFAYISTYYNSTEIEYKTLVLFNISANFTKVGNDEIGSLHKSYSCNLTCYTYIYIYIYVLLKASQGNRR